MYDELLRDWEDGKLFLCYEMEVDGRRFEARIKIVRRIYSLQVSEVLEEMIRR